jgi:Na+/glutamate symporter
VTCIVLSARISDILQKIAPIIRMCILPSILYTLKYYKGVVYAKFVDKNRNHADVSNNVISSIGTKRISIWVSKALVTNIEGLKQVWVTKRKLTLFCM